MQDLVGRYSLKKQISESNQNMVHQIEGSNKEITEIVNIIREIDSKTKVINDIVFQTKLLSFNASVEAARAGENGKGFSVVAEEISHLASMSGQAAQEITHLLDSSIQKVEYIVKNSHETVEKAIEIGKKKVDATNVAADRCGDIFNEIVVNVSKTKDIIQDIAQASNEQVQGINSINNAIQKLQHVSSSNSQISSEVASTADTLKEQVGELAGAVTTLQDLVHGASSKRAA